VRMRGWVLGHISMLKTGFGVLLVLLGIGILLGWDKRLEALVIPFLPDWWINLTTSI
jgi:cytochrome c-type biogenesis protein